MRRSHLLVFLCCAGLATSCSKKPLTGAKVDLLAGPTVPGGIRKIDFTLTLGGNTVSASLSDPRGTDIVFPTDAFFEIRSGTGRLDITASAKDAAGNEVDAGSGSGTVSSGRTVNVEVAMQGGAAVLGWGAPAHDFGLVALGRTAGPFMVALTNTGALATGNLALSFGGAGPYTIAADNCTGKPLGPGASCTVGISYSPNAIGAAPATLTAMAAPFRSPDFALSGSGGLALTVVKQGSGAGNVSLASGTPVCPDTCSSGTIAVEPGTTVSLVAAAQGGSAFRGWSSNCVASGSTCNLTVDSETTVSAAFNAAVVMTVSRTGTGIGAVVSSPAGIDCGTVCSASFDVNSTVLLTATPDSSSTFASWSLGSCTTPNCSVTASGPVQIAAAFTCSYDRVASGTQGSDANQGTCASPFKTIGKALSGGLTAGQSVLVRPGLYDGPGNGESFPLVVPAGVSLIGDEANKGDGAAPVAINGAGLVGSSTTIAAAVTPGASSLVAGLLITGAFSGTAPGGVTAIGIVPTGNNVVIRNDTITASGVGIGYVQSTSGNKVEGNVITGNAIGVRYDMSGGDLGGGSAGSAGGNVLSCNRTNDIWTNQNNLTINAANDFWDHASPTNSCSTAGADLCGAPGGLLTSPTNFVTTSSHQVTSPAPCP